MFKCIDDFEHRVEYLKWVLRCCPYRHRNLPQCHGWRMVSTSIISKKRKMGQSGTTLLHWFKILSPQTPGAWQRRPTNAIQSELQRQIHGCPRMSLSPREPILNISQAVTARPAGMKDEKHRKQDTCWIKISCS